MAFSYNYFRVGVGSNSRHNLTFYQSRTSTWHPSFDRKRLTNNIAIITLEEDVELNDQVQPIALPRSGVTVPYAFEEGITTGFGLIDNAPPIYSPLLLRSFHRVLTRVDCAKRFSHLNDVMADNFCAFDHRKINNFCGGDQGSAFSVLERGIWTAVIREISIVFCPISYILFSMTS